MSGRVERFELGAGCVRGEVSGARGVDLVATGVQGCDFREHILDVGNAAVEALAHNHIDFDLGHV